MTGTDFVLEIGACHLLSVTSCHLGTMPAMPSTTSATTVNLPRDTNQALGIGRYAVDFMSGRLGEPAPAVLERTLRFFTDSIVCGISAVSLGTNAQAVAVSDDGRTIAGYRGVGDSSSAAVVWRCS